MGILSKRHKRWKVVVILTLLLITIVNQVLVIRSNKTITNTSFERKISSNSTIKEYSFDDLGIDILTMEWLGIGEFQNELCNTFDLSNSGPAIMIIQYFYIGDKPESPGYEISGFFNQENFSTTISRGMLGSNPLNNKEVVIPLSSEGRIYSNQLNLTITASNTNEVEATGGITILGSSKLIIGEVLRIENYGIYPIYFYPSSWNGLSSMSGTRMETFIQFTVFNETILSKSNCDLKFAYYLAGEVTNSQFLFDQEENAFQIREVDADNDLTNASSAIEPNMGLNIFTLEIVIYSKGLFATNYNLTFTNCYLEIEPAGAGWGFDNLVIPFFNWPLHPFIGVLLLSLWILPYSILKYREWKKDPDEVDVNLLDDEDDGSNVLDPEGLSAGDDDDDIDETLDLEDDF